MCFESFEDHCSDRFGRLRLMNEYPMDQIGIYRIINGLDLLLGKGQTLQSHSSSFISFFYFLFSYFTVTGRVRHYQRLRVK